MEWYEQEVREMEQRRRVSPPPAGLVLFYGSSSIRMWESLEEDFRDVGVLNMAFGGSTLAACVWFFERLVVPCRPRSIICYAGDNDLGDGRMPEDVVVSFRNLLAKVDTHFPQIPFSMLSIKPSPSRWHLSDRIRFINEAIKREMQGRDNRYFIDIHAAMLGSDGQPDNSLFLEDGLHVSQKGYQVWKELLLDRSGEIF
ncbi:MAG: GDSL family lipase [Desulfuromonadales bacterium]|nr:GDSL family lipase [Desulfuromonadales bacterium]